MMNGYRVQEDAKVSWIPVGGCGEIGLNLSILSIDGYSLGIDCGSMFPQVGSIGYECIIADPLDFLEYGFSIHAWIFTHAHEDHIGAISHFYVQHPAPLYGTALTIELIQEKLLESRIVCRDYHVVQYGEWIKVTPTVDMMYIPLEHSILDSAGILFRSAYGTFFYTGDFFLHDLSYKNYIKRVFKDLSPISIMWVDSTNITESSMQYDEEDVYKNFLDISHETKRSLIVILFARSFMRLRTIFRVAQSTGRYVYFVGRSLWKSIELIQKYNLFPLPVELIVKPNEVYCIDKSKLIICATGSQGEGLSGAVRLARNSVENVSLSCGDTVVFSARIIPGNERAVIKLINDFLRMGLHVITPRERLVHVSGHACAHEIQELIEIVQPKYIVPIHGEYRHLNALRTLAVDCQIPYENIFVVENGESLCLREGFLGYGKKYHFQRLYVSEGQLLNKELYRKRAEVMRSGLIIFVFVLADKASSILACDPIVCFLGIREIVCDWRQVFLSFYAKHPCSLSHDYENCKHKLRTYLRAYLKQQFSCEAQVVVHIQSLDWTNFGSES